jgi:hypothetical protein
VTLSVLLLLWGGIEGTNRACAQSRIEGEGQGYSQNRDYGHTEEGYGYEGAAYQNRRQRSGGGEGSVALPSWAEPRTSTGIGRDQNRGDEVQTHSSPGGGGPPGGDDPQQNVPLGGLEWLIAAGAGYGFWKLRDEE